jgi:hypothetical protein
MSVLGDTKRETEIDRKRERKRWREKDREKESPQWYEYTLSSYETKI